MRPWSKLQKYGESTALRSSYIWLLVVPLAARLFSKIEDPVVIRAFEHTFTLHFGLPFSWKAFYFSAVFFAVASALFSIYCPVIIRDFANFSEFLQSGRSVGHVDSMFSSRLRSETGLSGKVIGRLQAHVRLLPETAAECGFQPARESETDESRIEAARVGFWTLRDIEDNAHPKVRGLVTLLYAFGFALLLYVLVENFWYVLRQVIHH